VDLVVDDLTSSSLLFSSFVTVSARSAPKLSQNNERGAKDDIEVSTVDFGCFHRRLNRNTSERAPLAPSVWHPGFSGSHGKFSYRRDHDCAFRIVEVVRRMASTENSMQFWLFV